MSGVPGMTTKVVCTLPIFSEVNVDVRNGSNLVELLSAREKRGSFRDSVLLAPCALSCLHRTMIRLNACINVQC